MKILKAYNTKYFLRFGSIIFLAFYLLGCKKDEMVNNPVGKEGYQIEIKDSPSFNYLLFMPSDKSAEINGKFPLIISLHGIGERGNDLQILKNEGLPKLLDGDTKFPFIVISPQCPLSTEWYYTNENNVSKMSDLIEDAINRFPIDTNRIYLTGYSMGGIGTWYFAINLPTKFAALAPVAFRGDGWGPCAAKDIPVWAFHGKLDNTIPISLAQNMVDQFKACGGNINFTIYADLYHDSWTRTYNNQQLYSWFLTNEKK